MNRKPTEKELLNRISGHLTWGGDRQRVALIWKGYLAGLYEWGLIDLDSYTRLGEGLSRHGNREVAELFQGEPLNPEAVKEIEDYIAQGEG